MTNELHQIVCTCYPWPLLSPALTAVQYVMYIWFCGWCLAFT